MSFGLKCTAQTFQRFMDKIFNKCHRFLVCYVDDILTYSKNYDEHCKHLKIVFDILNQNGLKLNINKCEFAKQTVNFLGFNVDCEGVRPTKEKIRAIIELNEPKTFAQLRSQVAMMNYYQKFIKDFQIISAPLHKLKPASKWPNRETLIMNKEEHNALTELKSRLSTATTLHHPVVDAPLVITTDASGGGMGGVLEQFVGDQLQPLYFHSKAFKPQQLMWDPYHKELEALYQTVNKLKSYLIGSQVYSDNQNLVNNLSNTEI